MFGRISRASACCGVTFIYPLLVSAAGPTDSLPALPATVVTASRLLQPLDSTTADVQVIDESTIRGAGATSLTELLGLHAGIDIAVAGGPGQTSSVFLRGTNSNHVLVLIDGIRVGSATSGTTALEAIPLEQIERIEVLRGPGSGLYGADAIGGVIQIFTRRRERSEGVVGAGRWQTKVASAGLGRQSGATRIDLQAGYTESDGFSATRPGIGFLYNPDDDGHRMANLGVTLEREWAPQQTLSGRALVTDSSTHFDSGAASDDVNRRRLSAFALESRNRISPAWTSLLRLARGTDDTRIDGAFASRFRTDQDQLTWQNDLAIAAGQLAAGVEGRHERVSSDTAYTRTQRDVVSAFGTYAGTHDAQTIEAALRVDDDSQFGSHWSGRLGYGWRADSQWRFSASVGTAFKAPTFADLYYPFTDFGGGFTYAGNPDLGPERAHSIEAAARYTRGSLSAGATVFAQEIRDLIALSTDGSTVVNVDRARIRGATFDASHAAGAWKLAAQWTHLYAIDASTHEPLPRRARNRASANLGWVSGPWRAGAQWVASGPREDTDFNTLSRVRLGGFGLVNLHAARQLSTELTLSVRLSNAGDKRYELINGYNTPRRNLFVALEYAAR